MPVNSSRCARGTAGGSTEEGWLRYSAFLSRQESSLACNFCTLVRDSGLDLKLWSTLQWASAPGIPRDVLRAMMYVETTCSLHLSRRVPPACSLFCAHPQNLWGTQCVAVLLGNPSWSRVNSSYPICPISSWVSVLVLSEFLRCLLGTGCFCCCSQDTIQTPMSSVPLNFGLDTSWQTSWIFILKLCLRCPDRDLAKYLLSPSHLLCSARCLPWCLLPFLQHGWSLKMQFQGRDQAFMLRSSLYLLELGIGLRRWTLMHHASTELCLHGVLKRRGWCFSGQSSS